MLIDQLLSVMIGDGSVSLHDVSTRLRRRAVLVTIYRAVLFVHVTDMS
jgi:hypothetical protein